MRAALCRIAEEIGRVSDERVIRGNGDAHDGKGENIGCDCVR